MLFWLREISVLFCLGSYMFFSTQCRGRGGNKGFLGLGCWVFFLFCFDFFPEFTPGQRIISFCPHNPSRNPYLCSGALQSPPVELHFRLFPASFFEWGKNQNKIKICWISLAKVSPSKPSIALIPPSSTRCFDSAGAASCHPRGRGTRQRGQAGSGGWAGGLRHPKSGGTPPGPQPQAQGLCFASPITSPHRLPLPDRHGSSVCHHVRHRCSSSCTWWACFKRLFFPFLFLFWHIVVGW